MTFATFLCLPDPLNPRMISFSTIQLVQDYEPTRTPMNKELYQALKYYQNRTAALSSTVPEAKGCNPTPPPSTIFNRPCTQNKEKDMYNNITLNPA